MDYYSSSKKASAQGFRSFISCADINVKNNHFPSKEKNNHKTMDLISIYNLLMRHISFIQLNEIASFL